MPDSIRQWNANVPPFGKLLEPVPDQVEVLERRQVAQPVGDFREQVAAGQVGSERSTTPFTSVAAESPGDDGAFALKTASEPS